MLEKSYGITNSTQRLVKTTFSRNTCEHTPTWKEPMNFCSRHLKTNKKGSQFQNLLSHLELMTRLKKALSEWIIAGQILVR